MMVPFPGKTLNNTKRNNMAFDKNELFLWLNIKEDNERQIAEWEFKGEYPPPWLLQEVDRCSNMISVLKKEAKEAGFTEDDLLELEYERIGGK